MTPAVAKRFLAAILNQRRKQPRLQTTSSIQPCHLSTRPTQHVFDDHSCIADREGVGIYITVAFSVIVSVASVALHPGRFASWVGESSLTMRVLVDVQRLGWKLEMMTSQRARSGL